MSEGIEYCRSLLAKKSGRINLRYRYYEMKNHVDDLGIAAKGRLGNLNPKLGWCTKAVDSLADRLHLKGWKDDYFNMEAIFNMNNADILFDSAILGALITGCSFLYIQMDEEDGFPRIEVIDGRDATGIIDPVTNLLKEGYAVLARDKFGNPTLEAWFETGQTTYFAPGKEPVVIENSAPAPLLVPVIYKPDSKRPFGHSRISRANMSLQDAAVRTLKRSEVSAEFYSFPQKYVTGLSPEAEMIDGWKATVSTMLSFTKDEDGDKPVLGQFTQQSMSPYVDQLRMQASLFAGENGLTLDDLGFVSDNPSSAEAIKAAHETLRITARRAQKTFGICFKNAGYLAACLRDDYAYLRRQAYLTTPVWSPIFEPDASTLSLIGDGAIKLNQAIPGYFGLDNLAELTGIDADENAEQAVEQAVEDEPEA